MSNINATNFTAYAEAYGTYITNYKTVITASASATAITAAAVPCG